MNRMFSAMSYRFATRLAIVLVMLALLVGYASSKVSAHTISPAPTSAGTVCVLRNNVNVYTWVYNNSTGAVDFLYKATAGRGFRWYASKLDNQYRTWVFGHSTERPSVNGWVLYANVRC